MTEQPAVTQPTDPARALAPRREYTSPRLTIYGTVQGLTHGAGAINGVSGIPDGG